MQTVNDLEPQAEHYRDYTMMPLAPHRVDYPNADEHFYLFYRTETSMDDFVSFVEYESTQVKMEHDFYLHNPRNRTGDEILSKDQWIKFEPVKTYNRTVTRQFLYEYYVTRCCWTRHSCEMKDDGARYWFFGKAVKDYIIMAEKTEFTYAEI